MPNVDERAIFAGMAKRGKGSGDDGDKPPVVSTLPPPEPPKTRKRRVPDDVPRGSLPAPKRKPKPAAKPAQAKPKAPAAPPPAPEPIADNVIPVAFPRKRLDPQPHGGALKRNVKPPEEPKRKKAPTKGGGGGGGKPPKGVSMTDAIFDAIIGEIAEGVTLRQICRRSTMPSYRTVYNWLDGDDLDGDDPSSPDIRSSRLARYARARRMGFDALAEEAMEIADDGTNDWIEREREDGSTVEDVDRDHIQRSKLRIETRLKLLAVWDPKRYGNMIKLGDPDAKPLEREGKSASDLAIGMAKLLVAARREAEAREQET